MQNTKLLQVLATLSVEELEEFHMHVKQLPVRDAIKKLIAHLSEFRGNWNQVDLELEVIGTHLGYEPPFKSLSNRASDLYKILMNFLLQKKLHSSAYKFEKEFLELKIFEERGIDKLKKLKSEQLMRQLDQSKITDQWSPFRRMLLYDMAYYNMDENRIDLKKTEIESCLQEEEYFSVGTRLKYACELLSRSQVLKAEIENTALWDSILQLEVKPGDPFQEIYQAAFRVLYLLTPYDFQVTFNILQKRGECLPNDDQYRIFMYLLNSAAQRSKREVQVYGQKLLELYEFGLPKGYLTHHDHISRVNYINILDIAYKISNFKFAENFIKVYESKLSVEDKPGTSILAEALLCFAKNEYGDVLKKLSINNFKFLDEKFRSHILLLCCLYELEGHSTLVWDKCKSLQIFIDRNKPKLHSNFLLSVRNFVNFTQKLLRRKSPKEKLLDELSSTENIVMRQWLEKKIQEKLNP